MRIGCACKPPVVLTVAVAFVFCAVFEQPASASSVAPMSLEKMSEHTAQAFVGEIVSITSRWAQNPKRIETDVTFANVQFLKGTPSKATTTRTLTIPGGEVDGVQARICCAPTFEVGQKWVLLILPEYRVHPVVGLHHGAIKVQKDDQGVERIYHASTRPITGIDKEGYLLVENARFDLETQQRLHANHSADHNVRINLAPHKEDKAQSEAMTLTSFLSELQTALNASKSYRNAEQAGRRVEGKFKAVPLRKATTQNQAEPPPEKSNDEKVLRGSEAAQPKETNRPQKKQDDAKKEAE